MSKSAVSKFFKNTQKAVSKHSPEILTGLGIAGMVTTTVLAVKATPKALRLIEEEKNRQNYELCKEARDKGHDACDEIARLAPMEMVKVTWKCYIPAAISGVSSIACLIMANSVHARRHAALATAYKLSETAIAEYREKVIETVGEKKEQAIRDKVDKERVEKSPVSKSDVIITDKGKTLCYDYMSGRYFESDIDRIKKAENEFNKKLIHATFGYASLNEFYDELGLDHIGFGDDLGWNVDNLVDLRFSSQLADDGRPCVVVGHNNAPIRDYDM